LGRRSRVILHLYYESQARLVKANLRTATLTWEQLCAEVAASGDTVFTFDHDVCAKLFDVMDKAAGDGNGSLAVEEIMASGKVPEVVKCVPPHS